MYLDQKYTHNVWIMFESVFCVGGQDVVEWKKKTLPILKFQQWQKVNECRWDGSQSTYQAALVTSVLCAKTCVKSPAKKGGCFPAMVTFPCLLSVIRNTHRKISNYLHPVTPCGKVHRSQWIYRHCLPRKFLQLAPESQDAWKRFTFPFWVSGTPGKLTCPLKTSGWKTTFRIIKP